MRLAGWSMGGGYSCAGKRRSNRTIRSAGGAARCTVRPVHSYSSLAAATGQPFYECGQLPRQACKPEERAMNNAVILIGEGAHKVLALHGWFGSAEGWGPFVDVLDRERFTWAFMDARGYG